MGEISRNTVNHLRSDKNACTECFRIVDAVFTKILRLQQLHMNLILVEGKHEVQKLCAVKINHRFGSKMVTMMYSFLGFQMLKEKTNSWRSK